MTRLSPLSITDYDSVWGSVGKCGVGKGVVVAPDKIWRPERSTELSRTVRERSTPSEPLSSLVWASWEKVCRGLCRMGRVYALKEVEGFVVRETT